MVWFILQNFFFVVITMLLVYYIITYFKDKKRLGGEGILLENQVKWLRPFTIIFLAISITSLGLEIYYQQLTAFSLANDLLLILFFCFFTMQQTIPLHITEKGIYRVTQGFTWEEVEEYDFVRQERNGKVSFLLRMRLNMKKKKGGTRPYLFRYKVAAEMKKPTEQFIKKMVKAKKQK